jgi:sigma-B regulation protein RsbU (phosphoserine phosphatase)
MLEEDIEESVSDLNIDDLHKINIAAKQLVKIINENLVPSNFVPGEKSGSYSSECLKKAGISSGNSDASSGTNWKPKSDEKDFGNLLVVDDNETNRNILSRQLEKQGYTVSTAENGLLALELLSICKFDLVLLDILMPEMNGVQVLDIMKNDEKLKHIPVIMISALDEMGSVLRCIEMGAEEYLPKPFNPILLRARIGASLEKKRLRDHEQLYLAALEESQRKLEAELSEAAEYVRSLLPPPIDADMITDWCFIPSTQLGGDAFGYNQLDDDHFSMYLLDVCGHGVGAALHSISVANVIRSQNLTNTDFRNPAEVLERLNDTFPMENHNYMYFTIWYGVYNRKTHTITYANGGHPPAILLTGSSPGEFIISELISPNNAMGIEAGVKFKCRTCQVEPYGKLYIFSDGAYEISKPDGTMLEFSDFVDFLSSPNKEDKSDIDRIYKFAKDLRGEEGFEDDFSILQVVFK